MNVVQLVVEPMMNLVVGCSVGHGDLTVEGSHPPLTGIVQDVEWSLEETFVVMPFLVHQDVKMCKETEARSNAKEVIRKEEPGLKSIGETSRE